MLAHRALAFCQARALVRRVLALRRVLGLAHQGLGLRLGLVRLGLVRLGLALGRQGSVRPGLAQPQVRALVAQALAAVGLVLTVMAPMAQALAQIAAALLTVAAHAKPLTPCRRLGLGESPCHAGLLSRWGHKEANASERATPP